MRRPQMGTILILELQLCNEWSEKTIEDTKQLITFINCTQNSISEVDLKSRAFPVNALLVETCE